MTPLTLLITAGVGAALVSRPVGALHAYTGPLTPSGRFVPRTARTVCRARTRTLTVVSLSTVGRRRVCVRCVVRLASGPCARGGADLHQQSRQQLAAAYAGVTPFDLALDAWRAESLADVERVEWLALLLVGYPSCAKTPVVSPDGKVTGPLDDHCRRARVRLDGTRDALTPAMRAVAVENEDIARTALKNRRHDGWREREDRIGRLGFVNATA